MIELAIVSIILLLFLFPVPIFVAILGVSTTWFLYRKYESFKIQPLEGKKYLILSMVSFLANFICSIFLAVAMALGVHFFIYENIYLFAFNFIFCLAISLRWFDFTYNQFQNFIFKTKDFKKHNFTQPHFAVCRSFRQRKGFGLAPIYIDAGILSLVGRKLVFKGVFREETFTLSNIISVEKKSYEKIKISTRPTNSEEPKVFFISLKEQFYPFKSRVTRDRIFQNLSFDMKASATS